MKIPNLFRPKEKLPKVTHAEHYMQAKLGAPGDPQLLTLVRSGTEGPFVTLTYQWQNELSYAQADNLDTRVRAYITCAIYDAAVAAGLKCKPGPPHGRRPSWLIAGRRGYTSLAGAGFDAGEKVCWLQIGPGMLSRDDFSSEDQVAQRLAHSFQKQFAQISV